MTLDPGQDPDRFEATRESTPTESLDPAADPDRYRRPTLPGLLGEGAHEEKRNTFTWLIGLVSVFAFLMLVSLLAHFGNPR